MKDKLTSKMIMRTAKMLHRKLKVEKPYIVEVENTKVKTDFLRVIDKSELVNKKLVIDDEGNTKQVYVKPTLLL